MIGKLVRRTRERLRLPHAWVWGSFPKGSLIEAKDLPTDAQVRGVMSLLKQTAYAIYRRWKRADALASVGRNLLDLPRTPSNKNVLGKYSSTFDFETTEADAHATYRALIAKCGDPLPSTTDILKNLGLQGHNFPDWWPKHDKDHSLAGEQVSHRTLVEGLYPSREDIDCLSLLCMARSGWNPATVYALDVSKENWATLHGEVGSPLWLIKAFKDRSGTWQWTLSPGKLSTGFHYIVSLLIQRTKPLRALIESDASRCATPAIAARSPWIFAGVLGYAGRVFVRTDTNAGAAGTYLRQLAREHNDSATPDKVVYEFIAPSDWRDIYASHVFQDSRYSWVLVQWALGHKHMASTRHYLRRLLWRRYSEKRLYDLQILLIDGIAAHARVDATIIRARIDLGTDPSDSDIARLESHRRIVQERELSYSGYGCMDRYHPPAEVDPANPRDGSSPCRRGDRCPSCPLAQAIDVQHMAKRLAELQWLSRQVSATVWLESHYAADLDVLQADLMQWPAKEVTAHVAHWERKIQSGQHKVIRFGGRL